MKPLVPAVFAALAVMATPAEAVTFDFERAQNGNLFESVFAFTEGDLTVSASSASGADLSRNQAGLGVRGGAASQRAGQGEGFVLSFNQQVALTGALIFERRSGTDAIRVTDGAGGEAVLTTAATGGSSFVEFPLAGLTGSVFNFDVISSTGSRNNSGIRLSALEVAAIPGPAGALSLATALALAAGFKRRAKR